GDDDGGPRSRVHRLDLRRARQGEQGGRRLLREHGRRPLVRRERPGTDLHVSGIRWGYALNQWKPQFDDFVRREQHERALKTVAIAGFEGVELTAGTGRGEAPGTPQQLAATFGSLAGFREFLAGCGVDAVSSFVYDPQQRSMEHLTGPLSPPAGEDTP